jgi:hypothetical protein
MVSSAVQERDETQLQTAYNTTMHGTNMEKVHQALVITLAKLDCASLAVIARSSRALRAAVLAVVTSKSTGPYLLCKTVRDAAVQELSANRKQHIGAISWLFDLQHRYRRSPDILQGSTAAALLSTRQVPEEAAARLAAAGLRFSYQQVVEACARPVAGAWEWVKEGAVTDAPELAQLLVFEPKIVSGCSRPAYILRPVDQQYSLSASHSSRI